VLVRDYSDFETLGRTRDDAAGEAFDKIARVLGLGYPGGPAVDRMAIEGNPEAFRFPRVKFDDSPYDFSFSGLKTAVINTVHQFEQRGEAVPIEDVCASFQQAVVDVLTNYTISAAKRIRMNTICIAGGVAANSLLRETMADRAGKRGIRVLYPKPILCTDNAAMVASAGYYALIGGKTADWKLNAVPSLKIGQSDNP
jgi:N6-L-threonylcarbamoyladenine synthase